jgi:hypothetical protein
MGELSPTAFYARYSGEWEIDAESAASARETLGEWSPGPRSTADGRPDGIGGRPGGMGGRPGGMGGRPGGMGGRPGGMGGRPGGMGGPGGLDGRVPDLAAIRAMSELARATPDRITVTVNDSLVTVVGLHDSALVLPFGESVALRHGAVQLEARAEWDGAELVVERSVETGAVTDRIEPIDQGDRLVITRRVELGPGPGPELTFVFDRSGI